MNITNALPNSLDSIRSRWNEKRYPHARPWLILVSRSLLFLSIQGLIALFYLVSGSSHAWEDSIRWWLVGVTITNLISLWILAIAARAEGIRFWDYYRVEKHKIGKEVLILGGLLLIGGPLAYFPNPLLATLLWGDPIVPFNMMFLPLPGAIKYLLIVIFPISIALTEIPTYYLYVMPRLEAIGLGRWGSLIITTVVHSLQHVFFPFILDGKFIVWRGLMFLPFAIFTGLLIRWRPRLAPYMLVIHGLLDLSLPLFIPIQ